MSQAIVLEQVTKKYENPAAALNNPHWRRFARLNSRLGAAEVDPVAVALQDVSFHVEEGEIFGVLGPSGAGKSTLIRLIAALLVPDSGSLSVFGYDTLHQPEQVQRLINRISGEASFFRNRSVLENLLPYAGSGGSDNRPDRLQAEAVEILSRLGLPEPVQHAPMGGLDRQAHQKVALARSLLSHPRLLLLDEPTRGLDPASRQEAYGLLQELRQAYGTTILATMRSGPGGEEAGQFCDQVAVLEEGHLAALGMPYTVHRFLPADGSRLSLEDLCRSALC